MKEILNSFEYLPRLSEFWKKLRNHKKGFEPSYITIEYNTYVELITQPLTKGMFVPCVDDEPFNYSKHGLTEQFQQAKDRVLFEGWKFIADNPSELVLKYDSDIYSFKSDGVIHHKIETLEALEKDFDFYKTLEDAINAGVKLKLKG